MSSPRSAMIRRESADRRALGATGSARWVVVGVVVVLVFAAFGPALFNGYVNWDDLDNFPENPRYQGLAPQHLQWMFTTFHLGPYQPLSWVSLAIDYLLFGETSFGHHLGNLIYHALAAIVFFAVARRLFVAAGAGDREEPAVVASAALAALLFAVHPLRVESVAWATERRDVLSGLLLMGSLLLYLQALEGTGETRRNRYIASVGVYALSLLAKASGMTLPLVLLVIDAYPLRRFRRRGEGDRTWREIGWVLLEKGPYFVLAAVIACVALLGQLEAHSLKTLQQLGVLTRLLIAAYGAGLYLLKTIWPVRLYPIYMIPPDLHAVDLVYWAPAVLAGLLTLIALWQMRRRPWMAALWFSYLVLLAPTSGLVQAGPQIGADRYCYLGSFAISIALAGVLLAVFRAVRAGHWAAWAWNAAALAAIASVLLLTVRSNAQTRYWKDSPTLWNHVLACDPRNSYAHANLADWLIDQNRLEEALQHLLLAAEYQPRLPDHFFNLSTIYDMLGRTDDAVSNARTAIAIDPEFGKAYFNLGSILLADYRDLPESIAALTRAVELMPDFATAHLNFGRALFRDGRKEQAEKELTRALQLEPNRPDYYVEISKAYAENGYIQAAVRVARDGYSRWPSDHRILQRLAWLLATGRDDAVRNGAEALKISRRLLAIRGPNDSMALVTYAAALGETGQYEEARSYLARALPRLPPQVREPVRIRYRMMDRFFAEHRNYRDAE